MNRLFTLVLALAGAAAQAQFELPLTHPKFTLILNKGVKEHLKVTPEQDKKVWAALEGVVQDHGDGRIGIVLGPGTDTGELEKKVVEALDEKQQKRLHELWLQNNGYLGLSDKKTAESLGITEDQRSKLDAIFEDHRQKMHDAFVSAQDGGVGVKIDRSELTKIRKETDKRAEAVLTEDQVKAWQSMLGEKFEFKFGG